MTDPSPQDNTLMTWFRRITSLLTRDSMLILLFTAGCVGIYYAKALLSIFSGVIFSVAVLNLLADRSGFRALKKYPAFIALMCVVLVYVLSGIHSDDTRRWMKLAWQSIPYAVIPLGIYTYRHASPQTWLRLHCIFVVVTALSALSVMIDYALHFDSYNALYKIGKTIPTPIIHVRYSYFLAMAACIALALAYECRTISNAQPGIQHRIFLGTGIFLAIVVHVLAVRTGLLALYGGLGLMLVFMVLRDGKWKLGIVSGISAFLLIILAYNAFPSIANKIGYVMYDLRILAEKGALAEYSDNVRITSILHGLDLLKDNLITGTGIGDLRDEMHRMYQAKTPGFPAESWFPPISQYIFILTAFGLVGAIMFYTLLLYPLFRTRFSYVMLAIYATMLFASVGETTVELHLGKTVFTSLVCITMLYSHHLCPGGTARDTAKFWPSRFDLS